jgi:alkaline phosphatase D
MAVLTDSLVVGGVTSEQARVFMRVNSAASVAVQYSESPTFASALTTAAKNTASASDFTAIVTLPNLEAQTEYFYRAVIDGVAVNDGVARSFVTYADAGAATEFSFAITADYKNASSTSSAGVPAYDAIAAGDHAFLMQLGDFDHRNPTSLGSMRTMHRQMRSPTRAAGADFAESIAPNLPLVSIWDDHDFGGNNADKNSSSKAAALQAYNEYFPSVDRPNTAGIWHSFDYGPAEFFMLDVRSQRDPSAEADGPNKSMLDGNNIANDQLDWLKDGLLTSTATWKFIASGVAFNPTTKPADSWGAYARERQELVNFINNNGITGVVFLTGDLHSGGAIDDGTNSDFPEMSVPHANLNSSQVSSGPPGIWSEGLDTGRINGGYSTVTVSANQVTLTTRTETGAIKKSLTISLSGDSAGPLASAVEVLPATATTGPLAIGASLSDTTTGGSNLVAAEYFVDVVGAPGTGTALVATDGAFDEPAEAVAGTLSAASFSALAAGNHTVFVRGRDTAGNWGPVASDTFVKEATTGSVVHRINAGGTTQSGSPNWTADTAASPSPFSNFATGNHGVNTTTAAINISHPSVPAGTPMAVFQTNRVDKVGGSEMQWNLPVAPGQYEVRLYFAETWTGAFSVGTRRFDVVIEGATALDNYDIFADAGARTGVVKTFLVTADSNLDIDFFHVTNNPQVSAIEVLTVGTGQLAQAAKAAATTPSLKTKSTHARLGIAATHDGERDDLRSVRPSIVHGDATATRARAVDLAIVQYLSDRRRAALSLQDRTGSDRHVEPEEGAASVPPHATAFASLSDRGEWRTRL